MLTISEISKNFDGRPILDKVSFQVNYDDLTIILGKNGSGKSTLANIIARQIFADNGNVLLQGKSSLEHDFKYRFDYLLDISALNDDIRGMDFLEIKLLIYNQFPFPFVKFKKLLALFFEKPDDIFRKIKTYSVGMKKKLEIISCLLSGADVLILDEPTSGLDIPSVQRLIEVLKDIKKDKIVLIISHDLLFIKKLSDTIIVLKNGTIHFNGANTNFFQLMNENSDDSLDAILNYI